MTAQRQFTAEEYLGWTDNYARMCQAILAATGDEDTPGTGAAYAAAVRNAINGLTDPDTAEITVDMLPSALAAVLAIENPTFIQQAIGPFNAAVVAALGEDVNTFLEANTVRVHPLFRVYCNPAVKPANAFPPTTLLGHMAVTGSGAGTFTDDDAIDTTVYGGAQIKLVVTHTIGAASLDVTVHVLLADGSATTKTGTIPDGSQQGHEVDLGSSTDQVVDVTSVTFTGGTADDAFDIKSIEDRSLS